jgi:DNA-binding MarR family transcriptional regulator
MESATITRPQVEAVQPEVPDEAAVPGEAPAKPRVNHFVSLVCMSALLEEGGEADIGDLKRVVGNRGIQPDNAHNSLSRTLKKAGRVIIEGPKIMATEKGIDYMADNTERIETAHAQAAEKNNKSFAPTRYRLFKHLQGAARPDGWLMAPGHIDSIIQIVSDRTGFTYSCVARSLSDYHKAELVDKQSNGDDGTTTNLKLTKEGRDDLRWMEETFPEEIAFLEAKETVKAMREEINNMHWELESRELPEEFEDAEALKGEAVFAEVDRLKKIMRRLERRLDN